jgi:HK97 family phage major capsid protein
MNINERLEAAKAALVEAKDGEDADALQSAIDEFKAAEAAKKSADEADQLIKSLGTVKENTPMEETPKNLGEFAAKNLDLAPVREGAAKSAGTNYGFKAYTDPQVSQTVYSYSTDVADQGLRDLAVRQLFGQEQISVGNALNYFVLGAKEDNSAPSPKTVNQAAAKPQFHIVEGTVTATLQKIAGWFYETDELLEDNAYLASALNNRGLYELDAAVEAYLLSTLQSVSGIGTDTYAHNGDVDPDTILDAIMAIKNDTRFNADAIIINPTDYAKLRELKTASGSNEYVGGGCFYGPHGNGPAAVQPGIWGLNTVVTPNITAGTVLVGAFKQGATVVTKAGEGARIEVFRGDHDDAIYNRVTVVVEERIALATRYPKAFVKITEAAS